MEKKLNLPALAFMVEIGLLKIERELKEDFNNLPETPDGTVVSWEDFFAAYEDVKRYGLAKIESLVGTLPAPEEYISPVVEVDTQEEIEVEPSYTHVDQVGNLRFEHNKAFTWLANTGAYYGGQIKFVWPELGFEFVVPDARDNYSPRGHSHETYFCGTKNRAGEANGNRASVFGPKGKKATYVEIHYNKG